MFIRFDEPAGADRRSREGLDMPLTDSISGELQSMAAGTARAVETAAAATTAAEQVAARSAAAGFTVIAQRMRAVQTGTQEIRARAASVGGHIAQARSAVGAAASQESPQQTIVVLARVVATLDAATAAIAAAIATLGEVQHLTAAVLQGGQQGPMLSQLAAIKQVLEQVGQRGHAAKQLVNGALGRGAGSR
ncbi:DUF6244 family protein [Micromonospora matsumotoense]|uniref:DUF6244 family protein n=1 Tax=Micromonospora matsumotoense TaxID=121616 RepID=UPI0033F305B9